MFKLNVLKPVVLPHALKVALFLFVSGGLAFLVENVANLKLDANQQALLLIVINIVLAGLKKWNDESK